jgi:hypothetical protein
MLEPITAANGSWPQRPVSEQAGGVLRHLALLDLELGLTPDQGTSPAGNRQPIATSPRLRRVRCRGRRVSSTVATQLPSSWLLVTRQREAPRREAMASGSGQRQRRRRTIRPHGHVPTINSRPNNDRRFTGSKARHGSRHCRSSVPCRPTGTPRRSGPTDTAGR